MNGQNSKTDNGRSIRVIPSKNESLTLSYKKSVSAVNPNLWLSFCKPWLDSDGALYTQERIAPPPSKDFIQLWVSTKEIIFRQWKITAPHRVTKDALPPSQKVLSYEDFFGDDQFRETISRMLGDRELNYVDHLILGHIDYLNRLPRRVLLRIAMYLDWKSVCHLSSLNTNFKEVFGSNAVWHALYLEHGQQMPNIETLMESDRLGWKHVFFKQNMHKMKIVKSKKPTVTIQKREFTFGARFTRKS